MARKILIVDDDPGTQELAKACLTPEGFEVSVCSDGGKAWAEIERIKPDLVVLDVVLPGIDGYSLAIKLSESEATRSLPVIVLSAFEPAKILFQKLPKVSGFLKKPFAPDAMTAAVKEAMTASAGS